MAPDPARNARSESLTTFRAYPDAFIGREADLDRVTELFARGAPLVTIVGPPGMGKTRLSSVYAARLGVDAVAEDPIAYFCELAEVRDTGGICRAVAQALAVPLGAASDPVATLGRAIAGRGRVLLVLDNFEQLTEHAVATVVPWLGAAPLARFLVTSRQPLRIRGEIAYELPPLGLPDPARPMEASEAVRLLVERVREDRPAYALTAAEAPAVAEIVRQLDGMPLSIELAAARASVLGVPAVLHRLARRFELLTHGVRDAEGRQRTLRAAIDGSWNLLEPDDQSAFAQASVFRGGFTLEAAEAVIELPAGAGARPTFDVVQSLRENSLLRADDPPGSGSPLRFGMYLSLCEYAAERLAEAGGTALAERRHAAYYLGEAERWADGAYGPGGVTLLGRLALERENLEAVIERARPPHPPASDALVAARRALAALYPVVWARGPLGPYVARVDEILGLAEAFAIDPALKAEVLTARGNVRRYQGRLSESLVDLEKALAVARQAGARRLEGRALRSLGSTLFQQGHLGDAGASWEAARWEQGRADDGLARLRAARSIVGEARDQRHGALFGACLAGFEAAQGDLSAAETSLAAAEAVAEDRDRECGPAIALQRAHLELARARRAETPARAAALRRGVRRRLDAALAPGEAGAPDARSIELRVFARILAKALAAGAEDGGSRPEPPLVAEVRRIIDVRYAQEISLGRIAKAVRRTPSHVATAVRRATGRSVGDLIEERRLAAARLLLTDTEDYVDVIAERVGFGDPAYFSRVFRRVHGTSPSLWRRAQRAAGVLEAVVGVLVGKGHPGGG